MDKIKEILSKESLNEQDIKFLVANKELLAQKDLERLGLAPITPVLVVEEPVKPLSPEAKAAKKIIEEQSLPPKKKAGRPSKK